MSCITEILKLKGDKPFYPVIDAVDGKPWVVIEGGGTYKEHEYLIVLNQMGQRCGYVALHPLHPANKVGGCPDEFGEFGYDRLDISCHNGLTFGGKQHHLKDLLSTPCDDSWIGFDCGHYGDACDFEALNKYYGKDERSTSRQENLELLSEHGTIKSFEFAGTECQSIIDQLVEQAA
jgi:hypothetical protein